MSLHQNHTCPLPLTRAYVLAEDQVLKQHESAGDILHLLSNHDVFEGPSVKGLVTDWGVTGEWWNFLGGLWEGVRLLDMSPEEDTGSPSHFPLNLWHVIVTMIRLDWQACPFWMAKKAFYSMMWSNKARHFGWFVHSNACSRLINQPSAYSPTFLPQRGFSTFLSGHSCSCCDLFLHSLW